MTGSACVFPFSYKGVEYYQCTYADSPTPWCATQVDSAGVVVTNKWGDCETGSLSSCQTETIDVPTCTTESGPYANAACVFPFRYNGVTYTSCTTQDKDQAWCSTNTTLAGNHVPGYYGYCPTTCPGAETSGNTECSENDSECSNACTPGELFNVDCNTCVCNSLGEAICTTNECSTTSTTPATAPAEGCTTVSGPAQGSPCVFPFTFAGVTHQSCADWIYGGQPEGSTWCSTKVDANGEHVNGEGNYGFCGADCTSPKEAVGGEDFGEVFDTNARSAVVFGKQRPN